MEAVFAKTLWTCDFLVYRVFRDVLGHRRVEHGVEKRDGV